MQAFKCTQCGNCCKNLNTQQNDGLPYPRFFRDGPVVLLTHSSLYLQDWEKVHFPLEKITPCQAVFDLLNNQLIILSYTLTQNNCPLIDSNNLCTIYEQRPLRCQAFPAPFLQDEELAGYQSHCPGEMKQDDLKEQLGLIPLADVQKQKVGNNLLARYGDAYIAHKIQKNISAQFRDFLAQCQRDGIIKLAQESNCPMSLQRLFIGCTRIDISEFYKQKTGKDFNRFIHPRSDPAKIG